MSEDFDKEFKKIRNENFKQPIQTVIQKQLDENPAFKEILEKLRGVHSSRDSSKLEEAKTLFQQIDKLYDQTFGKEK